MYFLSTPWQYGNKKQVLFYWFMLNLLVQNPTFPLFHHHFCNLLDISIRCAYCQVWPAVTWHLSFSLFPCLPGLPTVLPLPPKPGQFAFCHPPALTGELCPLWGHTNVGYHLTFCLFLLAMSSLPQCATSSGGTL